MKDVDSESFGKPFPQEEVTVYIDGTYGLYKYKWCTSQNKTGAF